MPFVPPVLGTRMHACGIVLHGVLSDQRWIDFLNAVAKAIGMHAVAEPAVWTYPVEGKGGNGQTIVLPITESFLTLDTWRDHYGAYLFVCSCRPYFTADIDKVATEFGLKPARGGRFYSELDLK